MSTVVIVYDPVLTAMSAPGGMVFKWAHQRSKKVERLAKLYAPKATGYMASRINTSYDKVPNGVVMYVQSPAKYSIYPHEGTSAWSNPTRMRIPAGLGWARPHYVYYRRGQRPKPFLTEALTTVMRDL